ncbi:MAG: GNAT family N-acetyltransferase [Candidatus Coproplasma sp.]
MNLCIIRKSCFCQGDKITKIKELRNIEEALPLVWDVFCKYEAVNYPESGKQAFWDAIHSKEYLQTLCVYGAYEGKTLIGLIATRDEGRHIALFFVDEKYHRSGVGRQLWHAVLANNNCDEITVNSSIYAQEVYKHFGFEQIDTICEKDGLKYIPMKYKMIIKKDCPCMKVTCFRHGHCNECRAHHGDSKRLRPCDR